MTTTMTKDFEVFERWAPKGVILVAENRKGVVIELQLVYPDDHGSVSAARRRWDDFLNGR